MVGSRFRPVYRKLTEEEEALATAVKRQAEVLEALYLEMGIDAGVKARYQAQALTALEESVMWMVKGITA